MIRFGIAKRLGHGAYISASWPLTHRRRQRASHTPADIGPQRGLVIDVTWPVRLLRVAALVLIVAFFAAMSLHL
jgi:hypothetical protein